MLKESKNKIFTKERGFSLVEVLAVLGLAGAGTLGIMQLQKSQLTGQKKVEAKYEATTIANSVGMILLSKNSCERTFVSENFSLAQNPRAFNRIIKAFPDGNSKEIYRSPQALGSINIERFEYQLNGPLVGAPGKNRYGNFNVAIVYKNTSRLVSNQPLANQKEERIEVPYTIKLETDPNGQFLSCYSDINDIGEQVSGQACDSIGGTYDPVSSRCALSSQGTLPSPGSGSNLSPDNYRLMSFESFRDEIYPSLFRSNFVYRMQGGDTVAGNIQMQGSPFRVTNVSADTDAVNKQYVDQLFPNCPSGTVGVFTDVGMRCENLLCENTASGTPQYLVGFNPNGTKVCNPLVNENNFCSNGGTLRLSSTGSLEYQCCTPACNNSGNYCSNEVFVSQNNCGNCVGTKPSKNATWGPWTNTGRARNMGSCSATCGGGTIATEIEQVRVCNNDNECGGSTCVGNSQQWILGASQACNTQPCEAPGKCVGWGGDTANLFVVAKTDEVQNGCRTQYRDVYFDIVVSQFKIGNIYSIGQGMSFSEEVRSGDTPQTVLQRMANKINAQNMTYPTLCYGAGSTVVTTATVVSSNRLKYHINWQHQPGHSASRSCNNLDKTVCQSTPGCNWDTTSANVCTGWNYVVKQGTCSGTYYRQACAWNGMGMDMGYGGSSGSEEECRYSYPDQSSCDAAWSKGCYWGSVAETCYASTQSACSALGGGCSWKSYPDDYRSCTANSWESGCTGVGGGAGVCTWGPR